MRLLDEQTKLLPISSEYYEALLADLEKYMQLVEQDVITIICDRLRKIGEMNPTSKKQISDLVRFYGSDMDKIKKAIAKRLKLSAEEVDLIFEQAATDSADFATALAMGRQDLIDTRRMEQLAMAAAKRYKDYLLNLPDTFAFKFGDQLLPIRKAYIALTNQATLAVQSGALDYNTAIRNTVKRLADNGLQVINWESGYHRRADSSVRMNVMEGVRQLNQGLLDEAGKKFATGYELSAHDRPAPDHADIQGKQYTIEQFEALNSGLKRPIGTLNCMHIAYPIIYGVTKPTYSEDELEEMKANSEKEYEWQGKKLNGYECTQKQRWYETEIRKGIDRENALKAAGDETGYRIEALKTSKLRSEYKAFSQHVGLSEKLNRTGYGSGTAKRYSTDGAKSGIIKLQPLGIPQKAKGLGAGSNDGYDIPEHEAPVFLGTINPDDSNQIAGLLQEFRKQTIGADIECAIVVESDGKVTECFGTIDQVFPDSDLGMENLKNSIVMHNHVESETRFSFGDDDFDTFSSTGMKELYGCDEKYTYVLSRKFQDVDDSDDDWWNDENYQHNRIIKDAKERGFGYHRTENDKG